MSFLIIIITVLSFILTFPSLMAIYFFQFRIGNRDKALAKNVKSQLCQYKSNFLYLLLSSFHNYFLYLFSNKQSSLCQYLLVTFYTVKAAGLSLRKEQYTSFMIIIIILLSIYTFSVLMAIYFSISNRQPRQGASKKCIL